MINSHLLYQLSYRGTVEGAHCKDRAVSRQYRDLESACRVSAINGQETPAQH